MDGNMVIDERRTMWIVNGICAKRFPFCQLRFCFAILAQPVTDASVCWRCGVSSCSVYIWHYSIWFTIRWPFCETEWIILSMIVKQLRSVELHYQHHHHRWFLFNLSIVLRFNGIRKHLFVCRAWIIPNVIFHANPILFDLLIWICCRCHRHYSHEPRIWWQEQHTRSDRSWWHRKKMSAKLIMSRFQ